MKTIDEAINYAAGNLKEGSVLNIQIENGGWSVELMMDRGEVNEHCYPINVGCLINDIVAGTDESNDLSIDCRDVCS